MIIKHITKIEAKTPRFSLNYRPMLMPTRLVRGWEGKSVIWEVANGIQQSYFSAVPFKYLHISSAIALRAMHSERLMRRFPSS